MHTFKDFFRVLWCTHVIGDFQALSKC